MHCLALRTGAKPYYRYTDPGLVLLATPCTLVHPRSRSKYTIQTLTVNTSIVKYGRNSFNVEFSMTEYIHNADANLRATIDPLHVHRLLPLGQNIM